MLISIFRYRLGKLFPSVELSEDAAMREAEEVSAMESTRREATGKRTWQKKCATVRQFQESLAADLKDLFPDDAERDDGGKDEFGRVWISKNIREIPRKFSDVRLIQTSWLQPPNGAPIHCATIFISSVKKEDRIWTWDGSLDSLNRFKLAAHPSQTLKFSNIQTVSELELILRAKRTRRTSWLTTTRGSTRGRSGSWRLVFHHTKPLNRLMIRSIGSVKSIKVKTTMIDYIKEFCHSSSLFLGVVNG